MLGGMKLLLDQHSLFTNRRETRLPQVLDASRKAQASVSTELSGQVLGALSRSSDYAKFYKGRVLTGRTRWKVLNATEVKQISAD